MIHLPASDFVRLWRLLHELHAVLLPLVAAADGALDQHFHHDVRRGTLLPIRLSGWIRRRLDRVPGNGRQATDPEAIVVGVSGRRVVIRLSDGPAGPTLHLVDERRSAARGFIPAWHLTRREADVMRWLVEGKTNGEIARILATQTRTVDKHCERIYQKLGVENRTSAVRLALDHGPNPTRPATPERARRPRSRGNP
ncbi:MAG: helix-turn-helix transcriptional regulator [Acidimicrobiia bacterium]|nr:helix-turn-helix transcriptional regulator [Acidimicrobiia bacterium]